MGIVSCEDLGDNFKDNAAIAIEETENGINGRVAANFTVRIENISEHKDFFASGTFGSGPAFPGETYSFSFHAPPGSYLSFATMLVQTNDLFIGPGENGIPLYNGTQPKDGDITAYVDLWDAGTEVNEEPGVGPNQAPRQSGPNTGPTENGNVQLVNDGYTYPDTDDLVKVVLESNYGGASGFKVTIYNLSGSTVLPGPIAPGVYVVHNNPAPLFEENAPDYGLGLEGLAEDGSNGPLADYLAANTGLVSPFSPGIWAVNRMNTAPIFSDGDADRGEGLEDIAEDGNPTNLIQALRNNPDVKFSQVFNTPAGAGGPAPIFPGDAYEFELTARPGDYLSFVSMFIQSNDLFISPDEYGLPLYDHYGNPKQGDVTHYIYLWDAGTEVNEFPGAGPNQAPRQSGPDTGQTENGTVKLVNDGYIYPDLTDIVRITITAHSL